MILQFINIWFVFYFFLLFYPWNFYKAFWLIWEAIHDDLISTVDSNFGKGWEINIFMKKLVLILYYLHLVLNIRNMESLFFYFFNLIIHFFNLSLKFQVLISNSLEQILYFLHILTAHLSFNSFTKMRQLFSYYLIILIILPCWIHSPISRPLPPVRVCPEVYTLLFFLVQKLFLYQISILFLHFMFSLIISLFSSWVTLPS